MNRFAALGIRGKLILMILMVSLAIVLLVSGARIAWDIHQGRQALAEELSSLAQLLGDRSSAALAFDDAAVAKENLAALHSMPQVVRACLYRNDGSVIADYQRDQPGEQTTGHCPSADQVENMSQFFEQEHLHIATTIQQGVQFMGWLYLESDLSLITARLQQQLVFSLIALLAAVLIAGLMAGGVQRLISKPIKAITAVAHAIEEQGDHSLRAQVNTRDEVGQLARTFNAMLDALDNQTHQLMKAQEEQVTAMARYRSLVESTSAIPWEMELPSWRFTFVGPQAESLLGYPVAQWYEEDFWPNHLHPADRATSIAYCQSATQLLRDHQFEYRMLAADGRSVWIHDDVQVIIENGIPARLQGFMFDISERKHTEEAIKNIAAGVSAQIGESFFQQLVIHLAQLFESDYAFIGLIDESDAMVIHTYAVCAHGKIAPNMTYALKGTPCANVIGKSTCAYPDHVQELFPEDKLLAEMRANSYIGTPLYDSHGKPMGLIVILDDQPMQNLAQVEEILTIFAARASAEMERAQVEQNLQLKERAMEVAIEGIILTDARQMDNPIVYVNAAMEYLTGYSRKELLGRNPRLLQGPDTNPDAVARMHEAIAARVPCAVEVLNYRKNGSPFWNEITITPVADKQGEITHFIGTQTDVSERRSAQQTIRKLSMAVEQSPNAIIITNPSGVIEYVNPAFSRVTGYSWSEAIGATPSLLKSKQTPTTVHEEMWRTIKNGRTWRGELYNRKKDGTHYWDFATISPIKDNQGNITHYLSTQADVTERKKMEEELRRHRNELERLVETRTAELKQANQELESFSYSVSHDLRAPLRAIDGFSQAFEEDYADIVDDTGRDYLHRVRSSAQRMAQLIDDLLQLSRINRQTLQQDTVNLSQLASVSRQQLEEADPARTIRWHIEDNLTSHGDPGLLQIVLDNLLGNASKYTSKTTDAHIEFTAQTKDGETIYCVRDNGTGFDMSRASKLFIPFQRLHKETEFPGSGIGLATVHRIINRHGGRIWAEAEIGKGASFYFTLPVPKNG